MTATGINSYSSPRTDRGSQVGLHVFLLLNRGEKLYIFLSKQFIIV